MSSIDHIRWYKSYSNFLTVEPRIFCLYIFVYSIPRQMFSYIVLGHYPVTNSSGMRLKLNYDFNCCKTIVFKIIRSLKG